MDKRVRELWTVKKKQYRREIVHSTTRIKLPFLELDEFQEVVSALGFSAVSNMSAEEIERQWYRLAAKEIERTKRNEQSI